MQARPADWVGFVVKIRESGLSVFLSAPVTKSTDLIPFLDLSKVPQVFLYLKEVFGKTWATSFQWRNCNYDSIDPLLGTVPLRGSCTLFLALCTSRGHWQWGLYILFLQLEYDFSLWRRRMGSVFYRFHFLRFLLPWILQQQDWSRLQPIWGAGLAPGRCSHFAPGLCDHLGSGKGDQFRSLMAALLVGYTSWLKSIPKSYSWAWVIIELPLHIVSFTSQIIWWPPLWEHIWELSPFSICACGTVTHQPPFGLLTITCFRPVAYRYLKLSPLDRPSSNWTSFLFQIRNLL